MAQKKKQSLLQGAFVLVAATAIVKVIGAIFKIPLQNLIDDTGMGYFSVAYDFYLFLYALSMAGLPVAISRMVSESVARGRLNDARKVLRTAQKVFVVTGLFCFLAMVLLARAYINMTPSATPDSIYCIYAIAPSLLFCCMMSSYRGYFNGLRNMYPSAISEVIEAMCKLVLGLGFAYGIMKIGMNQFEATGMVFGRTVEIPAGADAAAAAAAAKMALYPYAAAGAILSITIGSAMGLLFLFLRYKMGGDGFTRRELAAAPPARSGKRIFKMMLVIAIPIVIGSLVMSVTNIIDVLTVKTRLVHAMNVDPEAFKNAISGVLTSAVTDDKIPDTLYGSYKGRAYTIYNLIPTITTSLGVSAIPALSAAWTARNKREIRKNMQSVMRTTSLIAMPAAFGIAVLSEPILMMIFGGSPAKNAFAAPMLTILGLALLFAGLSMPSTNMLQAIGRQNVPVKNMAVGALLKLVVNFILVGIPSINIYGAAVGTFVCYLYIVCANVYCLSKYTHIRINLLSVFIKPFVSALFCGVAAWASFGIFSRVLTPLVGTGTRLSALVTGGLAIVVAGAVYVICILLFRALSREDVLMLKNGEKIANVLEKHGWIG